MIRAEIRRVIISDRNDAQILYLKEAEGDRTLPIVIGRAEAARIDRLVKGLASSNEGDDLLAGVIRGLGGTLQDIVISGPREHTYLAKLRIRREGCLIEVDSRPSDAVALALALDAPIFLDG